MRAILGIYLELVKPRALVMIVFTTAISFMIAATDRIEGWLLLHTCVGVALGGGGSLAINQYMERKLDRRMERTRGRPIPSGRISATRAAVYGWCTMLVGYAYLWILVNPLCSLATMACGVSYNFWYTPLKLRSSFSSFVGAIPGGLLPVMGWAGARNQLEIGAWVLFVILFLWQIPHALIISLRHRRDYEAVGMRQLPVIASLGTTNRQVLLNVLILIPVTMLPAVLNMTEIIYPSVATLLGFGLFTLSARFATRGMAIDAKRLFIALSAYLPILLIAMYLDKPH